MNSLELHSHKYKDTKEEFVPKHLAPMSPLETQPKPLLHKRSLAKNGNGKLPLGMGEGGKDGEGAGPGNVPLGIGEGGNDEDIGDDCDEGAGCAVVDIGL